MLFQLVSFFAKVKFFRFWPKTMDYNKAFWPKSRSFFVVLLLQNGRCYEAEICAILLLLRCPFRWNPFLPKSNFSDFGQKPWTIIRRFGRNRGHSLWSHFSKLEGAMKLKLHHPAPLEMCFVCCHFLPKSKCLFSGRKPWFRPKLRGTYHLARIQAASVCAPTSTLCAVMRSSQ